MAITWTRHLAAALLFSVEASAQTRPLSIVVDEMRASQDPVVAALAEGLHHFEQREWELAVGSFDRCIRLDSSLTQVFAARGRALIELERYAESEADYLEAIRLEPDEPMFHSSLALLYQRWGKWDQACASLSDLVRLVDDDAMAWNSLALMAMRTGRLATAHRALASALELQPDWAIARFNRAQLLHREHRYLEAIEDLQQLIESTTPEAQELSGHVALSLARVQIDLGDATDSATELESLRWDSSKEATLRALACEELAFLYECQARPELAVECLEHGLTLGETLDSSPVLEDLARWYSVLERTDDSRALLEVAVCADDRPASRLALMLQLVAEDEPGFALELGVKLYDEGCRQPALLAALSRAYEATGDAARAARFFDELTEVSSSEPAWRAHPAWIALTLERRLDSDLAEIRRSDEASPLLAEWNHCRERMRTEDWRELAFQTGLGVDRLQNLADPR